MCEVCKIKGLDSRFLNGSRPVQTTQKLYRFFKDNVAHLSLCYVHSIELFALGEKRFITKHPQLIRVIIARPQESSQIHAAPMAQAA